MNRPLHLGVLLPHTRFYGGVKRFLELGNRFVDAGHRFTVYTPDGEAPKWFNFHGRMATFEEIGKEPLDALWTTTVRFMPLVVASGARHKIFYHVRKSEKLRAMLRDPQVELYACSSNVYEYDRRKYHREATKAFGGVTVDDYTPKTDYNVADGQPFIVMAYGRITERVKGTKYVVKACEKLYAKGLNIKLLLYDAPTSAQARCIDESFSCKCPFEFVLDHPFDRNSELFGRADCFVSAENPRYSGWNNTVAEAMACSLPVISTEAGTYDLLEDGVTGLLVKRRSAAIAKAINRLYSDQALRRRLGEAAREHIHLFDWKRLANRIADTLSAEIE